MTIKEMKDKKEKNNTLSKSMLVIGKNVVKEVFEKSNMPPLFSTLKIIFTSMLSINTNQSVANIKRHKLV